MATWGAPQSTGWGGNYIAPSNQSSTSMFGSPASFTAAANTNANDYDSIMKDYANLAKSYTQNPITAPAVNAQNPQPSTATYTQSPDVTSALSNLSNLTSTGGYSPSDIADIRARDISPIRSIYANAQQNIERQKSLAGGYSPNYTAATAQLTRDQSNQVANELTAANAGIAQNVAANKIAAAPSYASAASQANQLQLASDQANANIINQINEANANRTLGAGEFNTTTGINTALANRQGLQGSIGGKASLYGTTPALTNTFGNQVVQAGQLGLGQQSINNQLTVPAMSWAGYGG